MIAPEVDVNVCDLTNVLFTKISIFTVWLVLVPYPNDSKLYWFTVLVKVLVYGKVGFVTSVLPPVSFWYITSDALAVEVLDTM